MPWGARRRDEAAESSNAETQQTEADVSEKTTEAPTVEASSQEVDAPTSAVEAPPIEETAAAPTVEAAVADYPEASGDTVAVAAGSTARAGGLWLRVFAYGLLPALVLLLAVAAGLLKFYDINESVKETARIEAVQAAKDGTVKLLSYNADTVEQDLNSARDLLTGDFQDAYTSLINDVVIPGAKEKKISAVANVPAAAAVSANGNEAVVLLFVNQTVVVGQDAPTDTNSVVRAKLEKHGDRWLIAEFEPI